jgi:hypothetical protein
MRHSQLLIGLVFAAVLGFAVGSCSSSSPSTSDGSTSSGKGLTCTTGSTGTCTQAELDTYDNCIASQCGSTLATCYGSGYQSGSFSGPCGTYGSCVSKCSCTDTACKTACGQPSSACQSCLTPYTACIFSASCTIPACLLSGGGTGGTSGGAGGRTGGAGGFTGSLGGSTGTAGTCADLLACCNAANATLKPSCMTEYNTVVSMGDATCGQLLSVIKSTFCP